MNKTFGLKWSELSDKQKDKQKERYGSKQGWQDAKARAAGFKDEQDKRGNSGERQEQRQAENAASSSSAQGPTAPASTGGNKGGNKGTNQNNDYAARYDLKWRDLSDKQKERSGSKEEHGQMRQELGLKDKNEGASIQPGFQTAATTPATGPVAPSNQNNDYAKRYDLRWDQLSDKQKQRSGSKQEHGQRRQELGLKDNKKSDLFQTTSVTTGPVAPATQSDSSSNTYTSPFFENVQDTPFQGPMVETPGPVGAGPNDAPQEQAAQDFLGDYVNNQVTYDDSELQSKYDTLSSNYEQLQASFNDLNTNFANYMNQQQEAVAEPETTVQSGPMHTGSEQSNPFGNPTTYTSPFTTSVNDNAVTSYLEDFQGINITPYQPSTESGSYTTPETTNPTNFTGYQPQVYVPANHYGTGNANSVAEQQQMYVSEGGQGFYGAPQVTPTNPFTGQAYELNESGLPQLPNNFLYGPGTTLPGQLTPVGKQGAKKQFKGIGT